LVAGARPAVTESEKTIDAGSASALLTARLQPWLTPAGRFRVRLSDRLTADAAASGRSIKLRRAARFSTSDLVLLAVHEGLVHVGTTLNARRQSVCSFLGHCPPATTAGQEGLAVLCELLAGVTHAGRVRRLWHRYRAVRMADAGADFRDVYRSFLDDSDNPRDAYQQAVRIFRGSLPSAGPFAKDATYALGLVRLLRAARSAGPARLRLLFTGKTAPADLPLLAELNDAGMLDDPVVAPSPFDDTDKLAARLRSLPHPGHGLRRPRVLTNGAAAGRTFPLLAASESLCSEIGGPSRSGGRGVPR
jgi:uncharacterized protein (TIGR02421 family)